jgi:MOSC domain-containing protein YiiM
VREGEIQQGDPIEGLSRPAHELTIAEMMRIYMFEHHRIGELLVPELPESWRDWAVAHAQAAEKASPAPRLE